MFDWVLKTPLKAFSFYYCNFLILPIFKNDWVFGLSGPWPYKNFNQLNFPFLKSSRYDHVHISFNGLRVI